MKKQKDAVMQFVQGLAETLKAKPEDIIQIAQQQPDALEAAVQKYQETKGDMTQAAQAFKSYLEKKTKAARHGAKLQYVKSLKNQCADDEEVYYYKKGGSLGCGCKKKENGGEVIKASTGVELFREDQKKKKQNLQQKPKWDDAKDSRLKVLSEKRTLTPKEKQELKQLRQEFENSSNRKDYELEEGKKGMKVEKDCGGSAVIAKFKAKCGAKMKKHEQGGSLNGVPFYQDGGKNKKSINDYYLTDYSEPNIQQKTKLNGKELIIKVNKGQQKGEDPITIQGNNYYLKGDSTLVKDNSIPYSFQQLRNAGINKKYNGGSLNQIPFYQAGTLKNGIRVLYKDYPKTLGSVNLKEVRYPDGSIIQQNVTYKPNLNDTTIRVFGPKTKLLYEKSNYDIKNNNQRQIFDKKKRGFNLAWKQAGNQSIEPFIW